MRIVQFVHGYPPEFVAGTERYTQGLSRMLVAHGHACLVIAGSERTASQPSMAVEWDGGVQIVRLIGCAGPDDRRPSVHNPPAEELIRWLLDLWRPEVAHVQHWMRLTNTVVGVCREFNLPTVVTLHDQWVACTRVHRFQPGEQLCSDLEAPCLSCVERDPWQRDWEIGERLSLRQRILERELRLAHRLLVPSAAQQDFLRQIVPAIPDRLEVVPLALPVRRRDRIDLPEKGYSNGPFRIGHWGYLAPGKGVHLLLEAAQLLPPDQRIEWHLYGLSSGPPYEERLERLAAGRSVFFHGRYTFEDVQSAGLDLAVFPSLCYETYSFVLDEAFSLGLPVVASNKGAFPERIGEAGLVFQQGDPGDLAKTIAWLLKNPAELARLKRAVSTGKVVPMEEHVTRLEKIYGEVVESREPERDADLAEREFLLHLHRVVEDRDREIQRLRGHVAEQERAVKEQERAIRNLEERLRQTEQTVLDREAALQQTRQALEMLQSDHANLRAHLLHLKQTPLFQLHELLKKLLKRP
ncbi:MAG: glycosyltransferase [Kofleriaceae bacterium]|nr:glycosyltransferase [Candidatus Methylomirabilis lanthanidiphila]